MVLPIIAGTFGVFLDFFTNCAIIFTNCALIGKSLHGFYLVNLRLFNMIINLTLLRSVTEVRQSESKGDKNGPLPGLPGMGWFSADSRQTSLFRR